MTHRKKSGRLFLTLIVGSFVVLALIATFAPELLNQRIAGGPATWGLVANTSFIVFVIGIMGWAIRPFARPDKETDR